MLSILLAASLGLPAHAAPAATPGDPADPPVIASVTMHSPDALDISYRLPLSCKALVFANPEMTPQTAIRMRGDWKAGDDCTEFDFQSVRPRRPECRVVRLRVPATTHARDSRHKDVPASAQPFGNGLYAHTGAYTVNDTCGPVEWHVAAPGGTVVVDGQKGSEKLSYKARDATVARSGVPLLLLATPYRPGAAALYAASPIAPAMRALLEQTVAQAQASLGAMLPGLPIEGGAMLAESSDATLSLGSRKISEQVLMLELPTSPVPDLETRARTLVTHEVMHRAQPVRWHDAWRTDTRAIAEGGAELLRLAASFRTNWLSETGLKDEMEAAVNSCMVEAADQSWNTFEQRNAGRTAYRCGLTLHLLGLARGKDRPFALQRLQNYYRDARAGAPTNFGHAIECGGAPACTAQRLTRVLGDEPLATAMHDETDAPDSLFHAQPGWGPQLVEVMVYRHLEQLLRADCRPGATVSHHRGAPRIGPGARCAALRSGMVAISAEGLPLFDGIYAVRSSARACRQRGDTVLGLANGKRVRVACNAAVALPERVWGIDHDKAVELVSDAQ